MPRKNWLIIPNTEDPGSYSSKSTDRATYQAKYNKKQRTLLFVGVVLLIPLVAHGSVLKRFSDFFAESRQSIYMTAAYNSQTVPLLRAASNIDPNPSKGGGDIMTLDGSALLAETGPSGSLADISDVPENDQISLYIVREGDSLSQIAEMFDVSANTIIWANDLPSGGLITPGQELLILPITGVRYVVREGDTLASIVEKYDGNLEEVIAYNGLASADSISEGDVVTVPGGVIPAPKQTSRSVAQAPVRGTSGPSYSGYYLHPAPGATRTQGLHGYNAVDLGGSYGSSIRAAAAGRVIVSRSGGWNGGYGNYIVIEHGNGTQTLYAHNSKNIVYGGQQVVQGQVIGYIGNTGRSTGPHLHFEVRGATNPF